MTPPASLGASEEIKGVREDIKARISPYSPYLHNSYIPVTFSVQQSINRFLETGSQLYEYRANVTTQNLCLSLN